MRPTVTNKPTNHMILFLLLTGLLCFALFFKATTWFENI